MEDEIDAATATVDVEDTRVNTTQNILPQPSFRI